MEKKKNLKEMIETAKANAVNVGIFEKLPDPVSIEYIDSLTTVEQIDSATK